MPKQIHAQNDLPNATRPSSAGLHQNELKGQRKKSILSLQLESFFLIS